MYSNIAGMEQVNGVPSVTVRRDNQEFLAVPSIQLARAPPRWDATQLADHKAAIAGFVDRPLASAPTTNGPPNRRSCVQSPRLGPQHSLQIAANALLQLALAPRTHAQQARIGLGATPCGPAAIGGLNGNLPAAPIALAPYTPANACQTARQRLAQSSPPRIAPAGALQSRPTHTQTRNLTCCRYAPRTRITPSAHSTPASPVRYKRSPRTGGDKRSALKPRRRGNHGPDPRHPDTARPARPPYGSRLHVQNIAAQLSIAGRAPCRGPPPTPPPMRHSDRRLGRTVQLHASASPATDKAVARLCRRPHPGLAGRLAASRNGNASSSPVAGWISRTTGPGVAMRATARHHADARPLSSGRRIPRPIREAEGRLCNTVSPASSRKPSASTEPLLQRKCGASRPWLASDLRCRSRSQWAAAFRAASTRVATPRKAHHSSSWAWVSALHARPQGSSQASRVLRPAHEAPPALSTASRLTSISLSRGSAKPHQDIRATPRAISGSQRSSALNTWVLTKKPNQAFSLHPVAVARSAPRRECPAGRVGGTATPGKDASKQHEQASLPSREQGTLRVATSEALQRSIQPGPSVTSQT
ncbi:hypothetical protein FQR65_LT20378 [Abscondita terminalis]|nr:hypothetical protein FQR65_LT20378 [Abscondita terminalis]